MADNPPVMRHTLVTRWLHWANFVFLAILFYSGLLIYAANRAHRIGWGDYTLVRLFPPELLESLGLRYRLAEGIAWHFFAIWPFVLTGALYIAYLTLSGEWRHIFPRRADLRGLARVIWDELRLRRPDSGGQKLNPGQRIAYTGVLVLGAGAVLTGLALYKPVQLGWLLSWMGGYSTARFLHFWISMALAVFFVIHVLNVVRAGWNTFRAMVCGYAASESDPEASV